MPKIIGPKEAFTITPTKNIVLITSAIFVSDMPLAYSKIRSIYSHEERLEQLKKTILSVRAKISDAVIILLETSDASGLDFNDEVLNKLDFVVEFFKDHKLKKISEGPYKGAAELYMLRRTVKRLKYSQFDFLHKISGRYFLNEKYQNYFSPDQYAFVKREGVLSTRYYVVPHKFLGNFLIKLLFIFNFARIRNFAIERLFAIFFTKNIDFRNPIGLSGNVAVDGSLIQE
ncbi:MAG TPA: hypothetical protein VF810_01755 [Patescibacteria group bacterium]